MAGNVLITGASRGIGRAIAIRLSRDGWVPLIHYRERDSEAHEVARLASGIAAPFGADLAVAADCTRLWEWAVSYGPVAALVNNAGVYRPVLFDCDSDSEFFAAWQEAYETNFGSTLRLSRSFVQQGRAGKILNVCSRVGYRGEAGAAHYAASKAAQINLVRSLAVELVPAQIGVFGIAPGWVETAMTRPGMMERLPEILSGIPLGRVATPEDCAAVAAFLLSQEGAYLSGQVIDVNGASYFH